MCASTRSRWGSLAPSAERSLSFPALDTLRFVGAFGVVVTHVAFQTGQYDSSVRGTFLARLDCGVALFFVLSGFLLSRPFLSRMARGGATPHVGFYAWKRALRIMPVYVLTVVLVLALMPPSRGPFWPRWVENLTMTTIYTSHDLPQGLTQMWSLATEVAFYAALPVLMIMVGRTACRRVWRPVPIMAILLALCTVNVAWLATIDLGSHRTLWLPAFLSWFSAGIALAVVSVDVAQPDPHRWSKAVARLGTTPLSCFVLAGALIMVASTPLAGPTFGEVPTTAEAIVKNILYAAFAVLVVLPGAFGDPDSPTLRAVAWSPLRFLGRISYGLFCIHLLVLYAVFKGRDIEYFTGHFIEVLTLTTIASIAAAALIHVAVETPVDRLRRFGRPKTEAATTPHATAIIT